MTDLAWLFADPPNLAVITTRGIVAGRHVIDYVSHDADDGGWQFLCHGAGSVAVEDAVVVGLGRIVATDATLRDLADLPLGWCAAREAKDRPWRRSAVDAA
ncbi:MAG TPA: hypothetical protein VGM87_11450 [Roseomonas sp.]